MPQNVEIPIHDIKPLAEVEDYSLVFFTLSSALVLFLLLGLIYLIIQYFKRRNRFNIREEHYKLLQIIDFNDPKKAAYAISEYGYTFTFDGTRQEEAYRNLINALEQYKYKKEVEPIDANTKGLYEIYLGMIDV